MSKEDMEFIQNAFENVCINEMKEIWKILDICKTPEGDTEEEINDRYELLEKMSEHIDGLENANNIVRGKRFNEIISHFFETKHKKIKIEYARIITQMTQNESYVQKAALELGIFNYLKDLNEEKDPELTKETDENIIKDGKELRKFIINQINEIKLHHRFINMLNEYNYNNENNCDIIHIIFSIIYNMIELFMDNQLKFMTKLRK